jgi:hypothetical protein
MNKKDLVLTTAMAGALIAIPVLSSRDEWNGDVYAQADTAVCVDANGTRVDDDLCRTSSYGGGSHGGGGNAFLWYYLGRSSALPYYGESIQDRRFAGTGTYQPRAGTVYAQAPVDTRMTRSQAVSRGGLGSSGYRFGGSRS